MVGGGGQGVVVGPAGQGKTFVVLDWALCIATNRPWQGRAVKHAPVVYVVAEGGRGIRKRIAAWMQENNERAIPKGYFLLEPVQLRAHEDYELLLRRLDWKNGRPGLIVFDTFARCFVGGDENTSTN